jgi:hypothetical protein
MVIDTHISRSWLFIHKLSIFIDAYL